MKVEVGNGPVGEEEEKDMEEGGTPAGEGEGEERAFQLVCHPFK